MSFDKIFGLTAGVYVYVYDVPGMFFLLQSDSDGRISSLTCNRAQIEFAAVLDAAAAAAAAAVAAAATAVHRAFVGQQL